MFFKNHLDTMWLASSRIQPFGKSRNWAFLLGLFLFLSFWAKAQEHQVHFKVDMRDLLAKNVAVKGSISPLSWETGYPLEDPDGDGIYEAQISFNTPEKSLYFKFTKDGEWELEGADNRSLRFGEAIDPKVYTYNEFDYYSAAEMEQLTFSEEQIRQDVQVLKEVLQYIHPAIYQFRDSVVLQKDFSLLEQEMLQNPNLIDCFKAVSKFVAGIKCSHTFTNPWNQSADIKKSIFYQPDKLPFTFKRIGKRLFIDQNASTNQQLTNGLEIVSINGLSVDSILTELTRYVTSDGNNYEKKLERLSLTGSEKYSLFDIFYPTVFGSHDQFELELKDPQTGKMVVEKVDAISKTKRTALLQERNAHVETSLRDGWNFRFLNDQVALLQIKSFSIFRNEFDWKAFIDDAFQQVNSRQTPYLIVDIRENEGGQGEVGEYILEYLLKEPFTAPATQSSVRYLTIPEKYQQYIGTWDKFPYDFTKKVAYEKNGSYFLKAKYTSAGKTYKPMKNGYQGEAFLLTDASNSSATHLMAAYAQNMKGVTLAGQETGGNQLGLNGSFMFFLNLPNTQIEVDIPVIHMFIPPLSGAARDGGIAPDIPIEKNWQDIRTGKDTELEKLLEIIQQRF